MRDKKVCRGRERAVISGICCASRGEGCFTFLTDTRDKTEQVCTDDTPHLVNVGSDAFFALIRSDI